MADNFTVNASTGLGDTFAADEIAAVKHQRVKIQHGADGSATDVSTASPLPINDAGGSITVDGTIAFSNSTIAVTNVGTFAVQASQAGTWILGANSGVDIGDVDVTSVTPGFAATNLGKRIDDAAGATDVGIALLARRAATPANISGTDGDYEPLQISAGRLYVSAQSTGTVAHDAVDSGNPLKIGGYASSTAPTAVSANGDRVNAWYDLNGRQVILIESALPAGTNNIGDVDVLTVPAPLNLTGGGVESAALRVTLANDSTGLLSVDDNGGSLTVDNAALSVTGGGVEASAVRVTIANDSTGVLSVDDNGGSLTVDGTVAISGTVTVDSELPTAAALADNTANPTVPAVGSFLMGYDGTNWDRIRADGGSVFIQDGGNSITVDGTIAFSNTTIAVTNVGTFAVQAAQSGTWILGANSGVDIGDVTINNASGASAVNVQDGGNSLTVDGTVAANLTPVTSGGLTTSKTVSAASTNATSVKASAGQVYGIFVSNINAAARYLKLYNKASAPTVGTDIPVLTFIIPGNTAGAGFAFSSENGIAFGTGIAFALTSGVADSDTGAVSANEHVVNLLYK